jgi:hypothetical protein
MKKTLILSVLILICTSLFACSPSESPGANPTNEINVDQSGDDNLPDATKPPVEDPDHVHEAGTPITKIDQIVGTWIATADLGNFVTTIYQDGRFSVASSLVDLEAGSTDTWILTFEGEQIIASDFALCPGETGIYLAMINEDGTLKITTVADTCVTRIRKMDRSLPGRLNPYNLIYYWVE